MLHFAPDANFLPILRHFNLLYEVIKSISQGSPLSPLEPITIPDNLFIKEAYVGKSLVMKRFRPRAKGRASPIKKPFSRITIILEEKKEKKDTK